MAKSFSNSVALNFISSAQQKEAQAAADPKPVATEKPAKPAKVEKKAAAKSETPKAPKAKVKSPKSVRTEVAEKQEKPVVAEKPVKPAKPTKPAKPAKAEKVTPKTPDLPMLNLNIPVVERKSARVQFLLKPSLVEKLKNIATAKNTSVNDLVNVILETVLK